ncbi:MAG: hypothetical protein OZSIB_2405 [Candidatus Ozemobacter sibiricus]|uniref:Uncharacterized protein n=1 Tax=Candidatus Ozemobacter sibiricus TaxID=2268124 RepID=A0A367ZSC7_9BACT|nr:MAG: hypothetical protein OZSIB_2405 [Candidatus Ozemobacter sibiricus]
MWIALLDFCLFLLLVAFFFYGLNAWDRLLSDPEEEEEPVARRRGGPPPETPPPPGRFWALWVLVAGGGMVALVGDLLAWWLG